MTNLLTLDFWFQLNPGSLLPIYQKLLIGVIFIFAIGAIFTYFKKKNTKDKFHKSIWSRTYALALTNFVLAALLLFLTYEAVPFFSSRFWFILWAIEIIAWAYLIFKDYKKISGIKEKNAKEWEFKKYLP